MKIYIHHPDLEESGLAAVDSFNARAMSIKCILLKYQLMWVLRSLENEIDSSDGLMIIKEDGTIDIKNFTEELRDKIAEVFKKDAGQHYGVEL